jgi:predicted dehydrogenase
LSILRGAISGFGEVAAQAHLPGWRQREGVSLMAIHDPAAARRHLAINLCANVRVYDDLALMLDGEAPEFVDIASPPAFHAKAARQALEAGAHVLVEKPLCLDAAEFESLAALARANQRVLMCAHNWHFAAAYKKAYELLAAARIGQLRHISMVRLRDQAAGISAANLSDSAMAAVRWRQHATTGGGILIDHGWHVFYLIHRLLQLDAEQSDRNSARREFTISAELGYPPNSTVDDVADLHLVLDSGETVNVHLSWRAPVRRTSAVIYGDQGLLEIEGDKLSLTCRDGSKEDHSVADAPDDSYHRTWFVGVIADFLHAIEEGSDGPRVCRNHDEVRFALAATATAIASSKEGSVARLSLG